jgi:UbiA prenyltransferase family
MRRGFSGVVGIVMSRVGDFLELGRPFTLVAPALGFFSGGLTAIGAAPYAPWSPCLLIYPLIGSAMAAVLNAGNNALNQIYDLEIDRINKPTRPLPTGRVSIAGVDVQGDHLRDRLDPRVVRRAGGPPRVRMDRPRGGDLFHGVYVCYLMLRRPEELAIEENHRQSP